MIYQRRILYRKMGIFLTVLLWIGASTTVYAKGPSLNVGGIISEPAVEENWADLPQLEPTDDGEVPIMYEVSPLEIHRLKQEAATDALTPGEGFIEYEAVMDGEVDAAVETQDLSALNMEGTAERESLPGPAPGANSEPRKAENPTARSSLAPALKDNFDSVNYGLGGFMSPADPAVAVGPSYVGVMVNSYIRFHTKSGTAARSKTLSDFFARVLPSRARTPFNPKIIYDHHHNRWVMLALTYNSDNEFSGSWWLLAVSKSSNPIDTTNGWYTRAIRADIGKFRGTWADYPGLGFDDSFLYITSNMYAPGGFNDPDSAFYEAQLYVIDKATLYNGGSPTAASWSNFRWPSGPDLFSMKPAHVFESGKHFYGVTTHSRGGNQLHVWHAVFNTPGSASWDEHVIDVIPYAVPPNAEQQGGDLEIDTMDCRIGGPVQYRNGRLYTAYSDKTNWGTEKTVSWIRGIAINTSTWTTDMDWGFGAANFHYFMPALYSDPLGNVIMVFNRSSKTEHVGIRFTATEHHKYNSWEGSRELMEGQEYYTEGRWGAYNGIAADPCDPYKLWFTAMYAMKAPLPPPVGIWWGPGNWWGTRVGSAKPGIDIEITRLWQPTPAAQRGKSSFLWAEVLGKPATDQVWFWVDGPSWTGSHWVGFQTKVNYGENWYGHSWFISTDRPVGKYSYWARVYTAPPYKVRTCWKGPEYFRVR